MQDLHSGTITRAYCRAIYEESVSRCFILPPEQGWQGNTIRKEAKRPENRVTRFPVEKSGEARIGGGERSEPISRMPIMSYDAESKSRNADFMLIARKGDNHNPRPKGPSNVRTLRTFRAKPRQPSRPKGRVPEISFLFLPKSLKAPAVKRRGLSFPYRRWNRGKPLSMMLRRTCVLYCFRIC